MNNWIEYNGNDYEYDKHTQSKNSNNKKTKNIINNLDAAFGDPSIKVEDAFSDLYLPLNIKPKIIEKSETTIEDKIKTNFNKRKTYIDYVNSLPQWAEYKDLYDAQYMRSLIASKGYDEANRLLAIAEYEIKNIILKDDIFGLSEVSASDFYTDLYTYPSYFGDNDKGNLIELYNYNDDTNNKKVRFYKNNKTDVDYKNNKLSGFCYDIYLTKMHNSNRWYPVYNKRKIKNIFAFCVDVDGVSAGNLYHWLCSGWNATLNRGGLQKQFLKPTYIINSGHGLHLYYVLKDAIPYCLETNKMILEDLFETMQYYYGTSYKPDGTIEDYQNNLCGKTQSLCGIERGYRMVGSYTKFDHVVTAFKYGPRYSINDLLEGFGLFGAIDCIQLYKLSKPTKIYQKIIDKKDKNRIEVLKKFKNYIKKHSVNPMQEVKLLAQLYVSCYADPSTNYYNINDLMDFCEDVYNKITNKNNFSEVCHDFDEACKNIKRGDFVNVFGCDAYKNYKPFTRCNIREDQYNYSNVKDYLINHIKQGQRYNSLLGFAAVAYSCGINRDQYIADVNEIYIEIQNKILQHPGIYESFTEKERDKTTSYYDKLKKEGHKPPQREKIIALAPEMIKFPPPKPREASNGREMNKIGNINTIANEIIEEIKNTYMRCILGPSIEGIHDAKLTIVHYDDELYCWFDKHDNINMNIPSKQYMVKKLTHDINDKNEYNKVWERYSKYYDDGIKALKDVLLDKFGAEDLIRIVAITVNNKNMAVRLNYIPSYKTNSERVDAAIRISKQDVKMASALSGLSVSTIKNYMKKIRVEEA